VILLNFAALSNLGASDIFKALILFPVVGRTATLIGASISNYARENGLGKSFIDFCGWREMVLGLAFCFAAFFLILRIHGLILAAITILTSFLILKLFTRKIGGATGDILGAVCELSQTVFLVSYYIIMRN
ncbi:MAG: adenosylcobinamide-GDP ribazoletransferase, partial [Bacillota bacterium]|nr:adenosylcobinamide-GDP ribazoletransferase [Bacillota bacterium]